MDPAKAFLEPRNAAHRQYEALRAYFVEKLSANQVAQRFGYRPGSVHQLAHQFRQNPSRIFFAEPEPPGVKATEPIVDLIVRLRKQNLSIYDISQALAKEGFKRTPAAVALVLTSQGFVRLPRRKDEERPATIKPTAGDRADARTVTFEPRSFRTKFGGLFLFLADLVPCRLDAILHRVQFPGSTMVPVSVATPPWTIGDVIERFCKAELVLTWVSTTSLPSPSL